MAFVNLGLVFSKDENVNTKILMLAYYCYLNNIFKEHFISQPMKVHQ